MNNLYAYLKYALALLKLGTLYGLLWDSRTHWLTLDLHDLHWPALTSQWPAFHPRRIYIRLGSTLGWFYTARNQAYGFNAFTLKTITHPEWRMRNRFPSKRHWFRRLEYAPCKITLRSVKLLLWLLNYILKKMIISKLDLKKTSCLHISSSYRFLHKITIFEILGRILWTWHLTCMPDYVVL